jgi:hypothetical protein
MSTTEATYVENTKWIDAKLASIFERTTPNDCLRDGDFPHPVRMGKQRMQRTVTKKTYTYTQQLRNQFPTTVGSPPPPKNAWTNRSCPAPQFHYTVANFPSLHPAPTPVTPGNQTVRRDHLQAPYLSSQTTMTVEQTRSYIDECVKSEQAKVTASYARLSDDIPTLRTDVKMMIGKSIQTQNERMQGFICDAITANTKAMLTAENTPYATKQEMLNILTDFKKDLHTLHPSQTAPTHPAYHYPKYTPPYQARLQHPVSPHETPVTSPANKKARARAPESYTRQPPDESEYDIHAM